MKPSERLAILYPTIESMQQARKGFSSWDKMSSALGFSKNCIYVYRKALGMEMAKTGARKNSRSYKDSLTAPEIDANIAKLMQGRSKNVVTTYKITDLEAFNKDVCGQNGLQLINTEHGSNWGHVSHKVSAIRGKGQ